MAGHDEPPNNHRWINAALLKKIRKTLPLMKFKNMTIAGNKALAAYDKKNELVKGAGEHRELQQTTRHAEAHQARIGELAEGRLQGAKQARERVVQRCVTRVRESTGKGYLPRAVADDAALCDSVLQQARIEGGPRRCPHQAGRIQFH